jgi:hypothetical protein
MSHSYAGSEMELGMVGVLALRVYQIAGSLLMGFACFDQYLNPFP